MEMPTPGTGMPPLSRQPVESHASAELNARLQHGQSRQIAPVERQLNYPALLYNLPEGRFVCFQRGGFGGDVDTLSLRADLQQEIDSRFLVDL